MQVSFIGATLALNRWHLIIQDLYLNPGLVKNCVYVAK